MCRRFIANMTLTLPPQTRRGGYWATDTQGWILCHHFTDMLPCSAQPHHTGNYTCKPSSSTPASIQLFVLGEQIDIYLSIHIVLDVRCITNLPQKVKAAFRCYNSVRTWRCTIRIHTGGLAPSSAAPLLLLIHYSSRI